LRLPFVAMMIRGISPYYTMAFVAVLLRLPFVAMMIRGISPCYTMAFVAVLLRLPFVKYWYRGSIGIGDWYIKWGC